MKFSDLEARIGTQNEADWRQHKNGGGWIHKNVQVPDECFIGEKAIVWQRWSFEKTVIGPKARIEGGTIWGGTIWGGTIWGGTIEGGTIEGGTIKGGTIKGGTIWGGTIEGGTIWGGTIWGGTIEGGIWKVPPLFIQGTKHSLTNAKPGHLMIGCKCATFAWWQTKTASDFGVAEGYTPAEVEEYKTYIELFVKLGK